MALTLQVTALVALSAAVWQHASAVEKAFSYSRQSVSGPPVVGPAQKIAVPDPHGQGQESFDYVGHPQYRNAYEVADPHSGDFHMHEEQREGDAVRGSYSVRDADGRVRTVHYTADAGGYRAEVSYSAPAAPHHPAPAPARAEPNHQAEIPSHAPLPSLQHVAGGHRQGHSVEGRGPVQQPLRPAPVHEGLAFHPQGNGAQRGEHGHVRPHRAQLNRHQHHVQHHVQHHARGLAHAQRLAEAQGLAHLQQ